MNEKSPTDIASEILEKYLRGKNHDFILQLLKKIEFMASHYCSIPIASVNKE